LNKRIREKIEPYKNVLIALLIILAVFLPNVPYLLTDALWHDDGLWYYYASEGEEIHQLSWRGRVGMLAPYRDHFYSYSMVYLGLPFTRGVFTLIMTTSSLLLYIIYSRVFHLNKSIAMLAAVIPNILPSLMGIPVGLNASYAMWALMPLIGSMLAVHYCFVSASKKRIFYLLFGFMLYALGLNLSSSVAIFLVPCVMLFFLFYFLNNKLEVTLAAAPFAFFGLYMFYRNSQHGSRTPTELPWPEIYDRIITFFEMSSFLPFNQNYSIYITISLMILGLYALILLNDDLVKQPELLNIIINYTAY